MNPTSSLHQRWLNQEHLNFWLTNRIPRTLLTKAMGRLSRVKNPWVARLGIGIWRWFSDLDLSEAKQTEFASIHDCFIRRLKPGLRPFDPEPTLLCSPCDAIIGAHGTIRQGELLQAKGMLYRLADLMKSEADAKACEGYQYLTLRLTSSMYHRFHAPHDVKATHLRYIHGDVWNVNPPALKRVAGLFAKNERAVLELTLQTTDQTMWIIPVAAVLVASMRFTFSDVHLHLGYQGPTETPLDTAIAKGDEMGWFEHGSTIICLVPADWSYVGPELGQTVKAGQRIWSRNPFHSRLNVENIQVATRRSTEDSQ